eukprot:scaffold2911_cov414-Prasinococcus_capsulatus_cf.AAC.48
MLWREYTVSEAKLAAAHDSGEPRHRSKAMPHAHTHTIHALVGESFTRCERALASCPRRGAPHRSSIGSRGSCRQRAPCEAARTRTPRADPRADQGTPRTSCGIPPRILQRLNRSR